MKYRKIKMSSLLEFVVNNDLKSLNELLIGDANLNYKDIRGRSPLFLAAENGNHRISSLLLHYGANVDEEDFFKVTPIQIATINGHSDIVKLLLDHGANRNVASPRYGDTLVSLASIKNDLDTVMLLIREGENEYKGEAVSFSIIKGCYWVTAHLISMGSEWENKHWGLLSDSTDSNKKEAFRLAVWLIDEKICLNNVDSDGKTPITYIIEQGNVKFFDLLVKNGAKIDFTGGIPPLITSIFYGHLEITKKILKLNPEIDVSWVDGNTPLHNAVKTGNIDFVKLIINNSANVNVINRNGDSPLHLASKYKFLDIQKYLIDHGSDKTLLNEEGFSALEYSMPRGYIPIELITNDYEYRLKTMSKNGDDFIVILTRHSVSTHKWVPENEPNAYIFPADQYNAAYDTNLFYDGEIGKLIDFVDDFVGVFIGAAPFRDFDGASVLVDMGNNKYTHYIDNRSEEFETNEPILWFCNVVKSGGVVIPIAGTTNEVLYMGDYSYDKNINHYNIENKFENAEEYVDFYLGMN